jgi:UDPglucose 6-dehydrogenase
MRIAVVGTGYVGLVTGTCLAEVGHRVTCVDLDEHKVKMLKEGKSPIYEPGLEPLIAQNITHERLHFTTKLNDALDGADVAFIAVGTPEGEDGSADLSYVKAVAKSIGETCSGNLLAIVKSTVPVGTCDMVDQIIQDCLKARHAKHRVTVASNPEFLKEGAAVADFMHPDRIIAGVTNEQDAETFKELYSVFVIDDPAKLFIVDRRSSELIKYGSNAMLATRISFMNELSRLCEKVGADIDNVRRGMGSDGRIGRKFLWAGPGYGGSCFPKDVAALVKTGDQYGVSLEILKSVTTANEAQKLHGAKKILNRFGGNLQGKTVAIWGLAFKPGTDDVREAPAITIIQKLLEAGAQVIGHDPQGKPNFSREIGSQKNLSYVDNAYDAVKNADALVLVTEWPEYKRPNFDKIAALMRAKNVFDLRNQWSVKSLKTLGFYYECIGRPDDANHNQRRRTEDR